MNIGIGALQENAAHMQIREILLGSAGVGRCPVLSNQCKFGLANRLDGRYIPAIELDTNRFWPSPLGELVWHLSTQVNGSDLAA